MLNKDEYKELLKESFSIDEVSWYIKNIKNNFDDFKKVFPFEDTLKEQITYNFRIDDLGEYEIYSPNAAAKCLNFKTKEYEVIFGRKLLTYLYNYAYQRINIDNIFRNKIYKDEDKKYFYSTIIQSWADFICLHELSHIINGHLEYMKLTRNKNDLSEFNITSSIDEESQHDTLMMEIDADNFATLLSMYKFTYSFERYKEIFKLSVEETIYSYCSSIIYLFDALYQLNGDNRKPTHPSPIERMTLISPNMYLAFENNELMSKYNISKDKLKKIIYYTLRDYFLKIHPNTSINKITKIINDGLLGYEYDNFIKEDKILKHLRNIKLEIV